jgi:hypothetical protein
VALCPALAEALQAHQWGGGAGSGAEGLCDTDVGAADQAEHAGAATPLQVVLAGVAEWQVGVSGALLRNQRAARQTHHTRATPGCCTFPFSSNFFR